MKILIIGERFFPEEFLINDIAEEWSNNGHEIHVLTQNPSYPFGKVYSGYSNKLFHVTYFNSIIIHRFFIICGYRESKIKKILNYFIFPILGSVYALLNGRKFDSIFIYHTGSLLLALPGVLIKKLYRKPLNIWTWDIWPDGVYAYGFKANFILSSFLNNLVRLVYNNCDHIFISSPGFKEKLVKYAPKKKYILAPNWNLNTIDLGGIAHINKGFNFLFAGNIGKIQNLSNIVNGFKLASQLDRSLNLNLVGDGSALDEIKSIVMKNEIPNVFFWGRVSLQEVQRYYKKSNALVISLLAHPAFESYIPSKFQTYLYHGKPILCAMRGPVAQIIREAQIGVIADPDNVNDIASAFLKISTLTATQLNLIQTTSNELLRKHFDRKKIINEISEIVLK